MDDRTPWSLLARYGGDDLTPAESARLEAWSANDPANARVVRGVRWMVSALRELDDARAMDAVWDRVRSRLDHDARPGPTVVPLPTRASRPVFHALERPRSRGQVGVGIAAALVVAAGLWAGWAHTHTTAPTVHEYATHRGERRELGLPDGSHVVLGAESKLWIATSRFTRERTLRLEGLAYFRVAPDASHPFVVLTRTSATQAVGTAFTVKAYPEDSLVQVAVTHGRVLLRPVAAALGTGTALQRGDLGQLDAGDVTSVMHDADVESFASWTSGRLTYDLVPLRSVVRDLERWYDLAITVDDPALGDARLTVAIDPRRPPSEALARVAEALNAHYELTGRVAHFRP